MTKKKYEVKSDVSEKKFQFFIKYLVRRDIPPISSYNSNLLKLSNSLICLISLKN